MNYTGIVKKSSRRGHSLGFPTVNIRLDDPAPTGSYIARVTVAGKSYPAAVYADQARHMLEAHILDFTEELYDKEISIELIQKIRESEMFAHDDMLREAIASDIAEVRDYFSAL